MSQGRLMQIMSARYSKVPTDDAQGRYTDSSSTTGSLSDDESLLEKSFTANRDEQTRRPHILYIAILIPAMLLAFLAGTFAGSRLGSVDRDLLCAKHTNSYSPVVKEASIQWSTIPFNGSLLRPNEYRQDAGPEVDAAWEALGVNYHAVRISDSEADASGLSGHVRIDPKHGGGYPANVEGLHHLHCLNLLRKTLSWNFEHYHALGEGPFANDDQILKLHATHCLDIIRQQLMCTVDTGVMGQVWIDPRAPEPFVDFNTNHRCKSFDAVRQWASERQLPAPDDTPEGFLLAPGEGELIYAEVP